MRRALAILAALTITLAITTPAAAYTSYPRSYLWVSRSAANGYDFYIPVCLGTNIDAPGGGWDLSIWTHSRLNDALGEFNSNNIDGHYYRTNSSCATLRNNNTPHLAVVFALSDIPGSYGTYDNDLSDSFCITNCTWGGRIILDPDPPASDTDWYVGSSLTVPAGNTDLAMAFLHELGHASGLDHSQAHGALMCARDTSSTGDCDLYTWIHGTARRYYQFDDILGLEAVWGTYN